MRSGMLVIGALLLGGLSVLQPAVLAGQSARATTSSVPRTPDGRPDLQGIWDVSTITPVERPEGRAAVLTEEQARRLELDEGARVENAARPSDPNRAAPRLGANVPRGGTLHAHRRQDPLPLHD